MHKTQMELYYGSYNWLLVLVVGMAEWKQALLVGAVRRASGPVSRSSHAGPVSRSRFVLLLQCWLLLSAGCVAFFVVIVVSQLMELIHCCDCSLD
jgi:hypothetical protein